MSSTRLIYDECAYESKLKTSTGVLEHVFDVRKFENCTQDCDQNSAENVKNMQRITERVDIESELFALPRNTSLCPTKKFNPAQTPVEAAPTLNHFLCDRDIVNLYHLPRNYSTSVTQERDSCPLK